jgi:hypothetical protein
VKKIMDAECLHAIEMCIAYDSTPFQNEGKKPGKRQSAYAEEGDNEAMVVLRTVLETKAISKWDMSAMLAYLLWDACRWVNQYDEDEDIRGVHALCLKYASLLLLYRGTDPNAFIIEDPTGMEKHPMSLLGVAEMLGNFPELVTLLTEHEVHHFPGELPHGE